MACNVISQQQQLQQHQQQQQQQRQQHKPTNTAASSRTFTKKHYPIESYSLKLLNIANQRQFVYSTAPLLLLLLLLSRGDFAGAEGNVGCQFVRTLCIPNAEVCYDDNIFGKCIPTTGVAVEDIERSVLSEDEFRLLGTMLEELQGEGLGWEHAYVQCRIQGTLFSLQRHQQLPPNLCANLAPASSELEDDPVGVSAYVRLAPPQLSEAAIDYYEQQLPSGFYPSIKKKKLQSQQQEKESGINTILHELQLQERRRLRHDPLELEHFGKLEGHAKHTQLEQPSVMDAFLDTERQREQQQLGDEEAKQKVELYQMLAASEPDPQPYQRKTAVPANAMDKLEAIVEQQQRQLDKQQQQQQQQQQQGIDTLMVPAELSESNELYFPHNYAPFKRPSYFRERQEPQLESDVVEPELMKRRPAPSDLNSQEQALIFESGLLRNSLTPLEEEAMLSSNSYPRGAVNQRVYTEGGLLLVPPHQQRQQQLTQADEPSDLKQALLANIMGFARHERLDVKKPGPQLGPPAELPVLTAASHSTTATTATAADGNKEVLPAHLKGGDVNEPFKKKKVVKQEQQQHQHSDEDHAPHTVDTEYAHVFVKNPIDSWYDGQRIMNELAQILHMQGYFSYLTVQPHVVSFRVDSNNPERKTAADVARYINENRGVKNNIQRRVGFYVVQAGVGDKVKDLKRDPSVSASRIELAEQGPDVTHIMVYMFAGAGAAAIVVIFVTLILIKRHDRKRDKLGGLQTGTSGAESCSKDYQDLCRARMAGKNGNQSTSGGGANGGGGGTAAAEPAHSGRITSLSKENEARPPSSRSSTSSWSEEPALTNMDISTGHMVLSYMEDHLRNKGRLQREWEALCRYEAEPNSRDAASQPQCSNLNRPGAPLPYDHSRVVLNHLANAEGLDYVNASTITDHDPRAPAYVAAQGPLPATLAHFWQMIWEQGAVVIVALCRLQENGEVACARYWPEEGAEVYHIYEVHLVSEHIWCDDYLVRSFYLKNLRTSETRTVTQFHFLSWPQMGVPAQAKALLDFRRKVNKSYRGRSCPIVVHGSAGAGRTGSYILLDLVLGRMNKGAREIDIAATLEHLRDQRAGVVATRQQFEFVLMAVAEEVHAILKALPANTSGEKRELDKDKEPLKEDKAQEAAAAAAEEQQPQPSTSSAAAAAVVSSGVKKTPETKQK